MKYEIPEPGRYSGVIKAFPRPHLVAMPRETLRVGDGRGAVGDGFDDCRGPDDGDSGDQAGVGDAARPGARAAQPHLAAVAVKLGD